MNIQRLKEAEAALLVRFAKGFDDPQMEKIRNRLGRAVERICDWSGSRVQVSRRLFRSRTI